MHNSQHALDFKLALKQTSEESFNIMWEKTLEADVTLPVLENRVRAMRAYAADVRRWDVSDWSEDTNWILPLIEAKKLEKQRSALLDELRNIDIIFNTRVRDLGLGLGYDTRRIMDVMGINAEFSDDIPDSGRASMR